MVERLEPELLTIPNFSQGRECATIDEIGDRLRLGGARVLDVHCDPDHNRSVYTVRAAQGAVPDSLVAAAATAIERIDIFAQMGEHPRIGAIDVAPIVYMRDGERGPACATALTVAERFASELGIPVFLYGELTGGRVTRAQIRRGGHLELQRRIDAGELTPDFGPVELHPRAGAVLVAARGPLVAFNLELSASATLETARTIAAEIREGGVRGLPGLRAIGVTLAHRGGAAQISTNIEDYRRTTAADVVDAVAARAPIDRAEIVGLPPRAAFEGFPAQIPLANARFLEDVAE